MRHSLAPLRLLCILAAGSPLLFGCGAAPKPTFVAYLIDFSESFAPLTQGDTEALRVVSDRIISQLKGAWLPDDRDLPVSFMWYSITSFSVAEAGPCGPLVSFFPVILGGKRPGMLSNRRELQAWHDACLIRLARGSYPLSDWTDISGALASVAQTTNRLPGPKVIVILSDYEEDRPPASRPTPFRLDAHCVVMLYRARGLGADDSLLERVGDWESRFMDAGATCVCRANVASVAPALLVPCLDLEESSK